ncbi:MAG: ATPase, T2SS/T4P/T4SS family [Planctomycetota bacterium]
MPSTAPQAEKPTAQRPLRVGDLLLSKGLIDDAQLEEALGYQKSSGRDKLLGEVLVELKFVTTEQVSEALAEACGLPFVHVNPRTVDPKVIELLPREFCEKHLVLPMFNVAGKLTVAIHEPTNIFLLDEVARITELSVQAVAASPVEIRQTLDAYMPDANVFVIDELVDDFDADELSLVEHSIADLSDLNTAANESPVIRLVNHVIYSAVKERASDIHIEPGDGYLRVRFRIDGRLYQKIRPPHQMQPAIASRIKIMAGMDISERRVSQDGAISVVVEKRQVDLRVSTMPGKFGEKVVIRIVDKATSITSIDTLGLASKMLEDVRTLSQAPNGIILVSGPTGSGKSTTLYAALNEINTEDVNICTVEDPVEYPVKGVNQFQTNDKAGFTFASALRNLLRQDPDVLMIGEIRDLETAKLATQAALTGHLVFSTLHTNDAPSAVTRLLNIGVEPHLLSAAIRGVLAQRLVRKICSHCKEELPIDARLERTIEKLVQDNHPVEKLYHGVGCGRCRDTGYSGRLAIFELFIPSDEVLDAIARGASLQELRFLASTTDGYTTLRHDGLEKVAAGLTTLDEIISVTTL